MKKGFIGKAAIQLHAFGALKWDCSAWVSFFQILRYSFTESFRYLKVTRESEIYARKVI